jgi:hypothetical protein
VRGLNSLADVNQGNELKEMNKMGDRRATCKGVKFPRKFVSVGMKGVRVSLLVRSVIGF